MKGFGAWAWEEGRKDDVSRMLSVKDAVGYAVEWIFLGLCALLVLEVLISLVEGV